MASNTSLRGYKVAVANWGTRARRYAKGELKVRMMSCCVLLSWADTSRKTLQGDYLLESLEFIQNDRDISRDVSKCVTTSVFYWYNERVI